MSRKPKTIAIIGAGAAGLCLAHALGKKGIPTTVFEAKPKEIWQKTPFDGRAWAISAANVELLQDLDLWHDMSKKSETIKDIIVSDGHEERLIHFEDDTSTDNPNKGMGKIIPSEVFLSAIKKAPLPEGINVSFSASIEDIDPNEGTIRVNGESHAYSAILVADGRFSKCRDMVGFHATTHNYNQNALVGMITHEKPHGCVAFEHFHEAGPLAILPLPDENGEYRSSIVWVEKGDLAYHMLSLSKEHYAAELQERFGDALGELKVIGEHKTFPLTLGFVHEFVKGKVALLGDSAHAIHPVSGQGLNLGLRDTQVLVDVIFKQMKLGLPLNQALENYQSIRRPATIAMIIATHGLVKLTAIPALSSLRQWGMRAVDQLPPLKRKFIQHASQ